MFGPVSIQHILTNSSTAERVQQSNHALADGQQKHSATRFQEEKRSQVHKTPPTEKSEQERIKREGDRQKRQEHMKKDDNRKRHGQEQDNKGQDNQVRDSQEEYTPRIDVIV